MIYRDALVQKKSDWCEASRAGTSTDLALDQTMIIFKAGDPSTIHECPYEVHILRIDTMLF